MHWQPLESRALPTAVYTLQMEEYSVSKKWVIIMDGRQDSNATSTPAGKSGPSTQDCYCARSLGAGPKARCGNREQIQV